MCSRLKGMGRCHCLEPATLVEAASVNSMRSVGAWRSQRPCGGAGGEGSGGGERVRRRVTGLLNRLAEANVAAVAGELAALHATAGRGAVAAAVTDELLQARRAAGPAAALACALWRPRESLVGPHRPRVSLDIVVSSSREPLEGGRRCAL